MAGFNTEIKRLAAVFHVQTQDVGPSLRSVESLIYKSGKLMTSRKTDYTSSLGSPELQARVRQIMEEQHKAILKEIADGKLDHYLTPQEKRPAPEKG
jgi:hypothetical protein